MANDRTPPHVLRLPPIGRPDKKAPHAPLMLKREAPHTARGAASVAVTTIVRAAAKRPRISAHALAQISVVALFPKLLGKIAAVLLVPMIFFHPLLPLYAEELAPSSPETIAPIEDTAGAADAESVAAPEDAASNESGIEDDGEATPSGAAEEEAQSGDDGAEDTLPVQDSDEVPVNSSDDDPPMGDEGGETTEMPSENNVGGAEDETGTSTAETDTASSTDTATEVGAVPGADVTATSSDTTATSTVPENASVTATSSDTTATSTEASAPSDANAPGTTSETPSAVVPEAAPTESGPSFEERLSAELEARSAMLREEIRRQVEREWTSGCVALEGTGYYCLKYESREQGGGTSTDTPVSAVSVRPGSGGDNEIFITRGAEDIQFTANDVDDAFPAKDAAGGSVVWQSQESGRWQVYFADMTKTPPEVVQLTSGAESNFNPKVDGATVVWQAWLDGNWEVVMAERRASPLPAEELTPLHATLGVSGAWNVTRLTNDPAHDMFPSIAGGLVTWQKNADGTWGVWTASIAGGASVRLSSGATKSENPRFAMVWEERTEDGAVRLVGYDVARGEKVDLTNEARNIPDRGPGRPEAPVASSDPAALPAAPAGATTSIAKPDGDDGEGGAGSDAEDGALAL